MVSLWTWVKTAEETGHELTGGEIEGVEGIRAVWRCYRGDLTMYSVIFQVVEQVAIM